MSRSAQDNESHSFQGASTSQPSEGSNMESTGDEKTTNSGLPEWAIPLWEDLGKPDFSEFEDVRTGPLLERRSGLRRDDFVEILLDSRGLPEGMDNWMRGRLMGTNKNTLLLVTPDGAYHAVSRRIVIDVILVAHMRAAYIDDRELLDYEREDMKRRNSLQEEVEKRSTGADDLSWG